MNSERIPCLPSETYTIIASWADTKTLKTLRLANQAVRMAVTRVFLRRCFKSVSVNFINASSLKRAQAICEHSSIAPHIREITFNVHELHKQTISFIRRDRDAPFELWGLLTQFETETIPILQRRLHTYTVLRETGTLISRLQATFQGLMQHRNYNIAIVFNDNEIAARGNEDSNLFYDAESILYGSFQPSYFIQARVILALIRSGLPIRSLDIVGNKTIARSKWNDVVEHFADAESCCTEFRPERLAPISALIKQITIKIAYIPVVKSGSLLSYVLQYAKELKDITIKGFEESFQDRFRERSADDLAIELGKLSRYSSLNFLFDTISQRSLSLVRLECITVEATDLAQLLRASAVTLEALQIESVILWGDLRVFDSFCGGEFLKLTRECVWFSDVKYFDGESLIRWNPLFIESYY